MLYTIYTYTTYRGLQGIPVYLTGIIYLKEYRRESRLYIYIYSQKPRFIAIPIGAKAQHLNVTTNSIWSLTRSFRDQTSNSLTWI